jgi:hypothetical protein
VLASGPLVARRQSCRGRRHAHARKLGTCPWTSPAADPFEPNAAVRSSLPIEEHLRQLRPVGRREIGNGSGEHGQRVALVLVGGR